MWHQETTPIGCMWINTAVWSLWPKRRGGAKGANSQGLLSCCPFLHLGPLGHGYCRKFGVPQKHCNRHLVQPSRSGFGPLHAGMCTWFNRNNLARKGASEILPTNVNRMMHLPPKAAVPAFVKDKLENRARKYALTVTNKSFHAWWHGSSRTNWEAQLSIIYPFPFLAPW